MIARRLGYKRFLEAPIRLRHQFTSTVSWRSVYRSLLDTMAIWYRLRILHFYDGDQAPATPGGEGLRIDPIVLRGGAGTAAGSAGAPGTRRGAARLVPLVREIRQASAVWRQGAAVLRLVAEGRRSNPPLPAVSHHFLHGGYRSGPGERTSLSLVKQNRGDSDGSGDRGLTFAVFGAGRLHG